MTPNELPELFYVASIDMARVRHAARWSNLGRRDCARRFRVCEELWRTNVAVLVVTVALRLWFQITSLLVVVFWFCRAGFVVMVSSLCLEAECW